MGIPEPDGLNRNRPVRVAMYLRVSTADQGRRGFSIPEQRRACLEKAAALARARAATTGGGAELETAEFVDTAGGDLLERPELEQARRYVAAARPDYFVCLDPDRFSRATHQAILVANEIEAAGTRLEFVQHDYQATSEGRLFFTLRVAIAEYEKAKIIERTSRGKRGKLAAGGIPHRIHVYGYDHRPGAPGDQALVPNPAEAAWVEQMFTWVAAERLGSQAVAERLNRLRVPAKNGGVWHRGVVAGILRNPIYVGQLRLNRYDFRGLGGQLQLPPARRSRKITPRLRPAAEWVTVAVPAILPRALFAQAQAVLQQVKRQGGTRLHPGRRGHLLSGLATCGLCGGPMHYVWNNRLSCYLLRCANRYPSPRRAAGPPPAACRQPHQRADRVEQHVWATIQRWLLDPELLQAERERQWGDAGLAQGGPEQERTRLQQQMTLAKAAQARVLGLVGKGVVHPEVAAAQLAESSRHVAALEQEYARLPAAAAVADVALAPAPAPVHGCWQRWLAELDLPQRQTVVRMLLRAVRVLPGAVAEVVPTRE